jgi:hypothetical protein
MKVEPFMQRRKRLRKERELKKRIEKRIYEAEIRVNRLIIARMRELEKDHELMKRIDGEVAGVIDDATAQAYIERAAMLAGEDC